MIYVIEHERRVHACLPAIPSPGRYVIPFFPMASLTSISMGYFLIKKYYFVYYSQYVVLGFPYKRKNGTYHMSLRHLHQTLS